MFSSGRYWVALMLSSESWGVSGWGPRGLGPVPSALADTYSSLAQVAGWAGAGRRGLGWRLRFFLGFLRRRRWVRLCLALDLAEAPARGRACLCRAARGRACLCRAARRRLCRRFFLRFFLRCLAGFLRAGALAAAHAPGVAGATWTSVGYWAVGIRPSSVHAAAPAWSGRAKALISSPPPSATSSSWRLASTARASGAVPRPGPRSTVSVRSRWRAAASMTATSSELVTVT